MSEGSTKEKRKVQFALISLGHSVVPGGIGQGEGARLHQAV